LSVMADRTKDRNTLKIVSECDMRRPIQLPPNLVPRIPAASAPTSGAMGTARSVERERV